MSFPFWRPIKLPPSRIPSGLNSNKASKTSSLAITFIFSTCQIMKALLLPRSLPSPYWINNSGLLPSKMPVFGVMNNYRLTSLVCKATCKPYSTPPGQPPLSYSCAYSFTQFLWDMCPPLLAMASTMVSLIDPLLRLGQCCRKCCSDIFSSWHIAWKLISIAIVISFHTMQLKDTLLWQ